MSGTEIDLYKLNSIIVKKKQEKADSIHKFINDNFPDTIMDKSMFFMLKGLFDNRVLSEENYVSHILEQDTKALNIIMQTLIIFFRVMSSIQVGKYTDVFNTVPTIPNKNVIDTLAEKLNEYDNLEKSITVNINELPKFIEENKHLLDEP